MIVPLVNVLARFIKFFLYFKRIPYCLNKHKCGEWFFLKNFLSLYAAILVESVKKSLAQLTRTSENVILARKINPCLETKMGNHISAQLSTLLFTLLFLRCNRVHSRAMYDRSIMMMTIRKMRREKNVF
jgi:hypothetical protein